jgi:hypothetical protein
VDVGGRDDAGTATMSGPMVSSSTGSGVSFDRMAMFTNPPPPDTGMVGVKVGSIVPLIWATGPPKEPPDEA